jgi:hypothetical protein
MPLPLDPDNGKVDVEFVDTQNKVSSILPKVLKLIIELILCAAFVGVLAFVLLRWVDRREEEAKATVCFAELAKQKEDYSSKRLELTQIEGELDQLYAERKIDQYNAKIDVYDVVVEDINTKARLYNVKSTECRLLAEQSNMPLVDIELPEAIEEYIKPEE